MSNFNDKVLKSVAETAAKIMAEISQGSTPKTPKEKSLAALAHPKDKITHKDVLVGRGVLKKEETEELDEAKKKPMSQDEKDKVVGAVQAAMRKSRGNVIAGQAQRAAARLAAKVKYGMKEEVEELDEAFPTVADGEKSLKAKEGKTTHGKITKTKTGVKHERDYDDQPEPEVKRGRGRPKKRLSEMRQEYFNYFEEEVDNETFTKELEDQKAKFDGKKKGADVAKPAVQAVKQEEVELDEEIHSPGTKVRVPHKGKMVSGKVVRHDKGSGGYSPAYVVDVGEYESKIVPSHKVQKEEVEQIDEISKETAGKYLTAPQGKGANKYKVSSDKSVYPNIETMTKHSTNVRRALKRSEGSSLYKKPDYYKEEVEQMDEVAPPGREDQVKALKKVPGITNPYAVSWASYRKSHPKKD